MLGRVARTAVTLADRPGWTKQSGAKRKKVGEQQPDSAAYSAKDLTQASQQPGDASCGVSNPWTWNTPIMSYKRQTSLVNMLAARRLTIELGKISDRTVSIHGSTIMSIASTGRHNYAGSAQSFARIAHSGFTIQFLHQPRDQRRDEHSDSLS
ncbi:hypothetical protein SMMN14_04209 [Sphaerulina musiva]